jgi:Uma2 family endonuclease
MSSSERGLVDIHFSPLQRRYTLEEFWELPERNDHCHYNLIGGYLFLVPPPEPPHGDVVSQASRLLTTFLIATKSGGIHYFPPEPIYQRENSTYLEPDLFYVSQSLRARMGLQHTSADIVFEVLTRGSNIYDRTTKADTYLALGVRELWLVDPFCATIETRHPDKAGEKQVWEISKYSHGQQAKSRVLEGFEVPVSDLFAGIG